MIAKNRYHIQNSNTESLNELEPRSRNEQGDRMVPQRRSAAEPIKAFPLGMVLRACPQISDYGAGGVISHWRELMTAAVVVRTTLGVSPSAYQEACEVMGPENGRGRNGLRSRAGRSHQFTRRISARSNTASGTRRVLARADADGVASDAGARWAQIGMTIRA